jgi:hypothetical protein
MFEKINQDVSNVITIEKKYKRITTEDLRRFLNTNGEDKELNAKLAQWKIVADNSLINEKTSTISLFNMPEGRDDEDDSELELSKADKTWKDGKLDENGVEITYKVKPHVLTIPDEEQFEPIIEKQYVVKGLKEDSYIEPVTPILSEEENLEEINKLFAKLEPVRITPVIETNKTNNPFLSKLKQIFKF